MKRILSAIFALVLLLSSGQAALVNSISSLHQARPAMVPSAAHQGNPQAARYTADTYEFSIPDYQAIYWPDYDMLQVTMQETGGKWTFYFAFDGMHKLHPGLYTLPDMNPNYSFAQDTEGNWFRYTTASFTYTVDEEGVRRLDITVSDHTGHTYHITFSDPVRPTSFKDVYLTMNDVTLTDRAADMQAVQLQGSTDKYEAGFALTTGNSDICGSYEVSDLYYKWDYTYLNYRGERLMLCDFNAQVTAGAEPGEFNCLLTYYAYDGNCYHVTMNYDIPTVTDTIDIVCTNLQFQPMYMYGSLVGYVLEASNRSYTLQLQVSYFQGIYQGALLEKGREGAVELFTDRFTLTNRTSASGYAIGTDGTYYRFALSCAMIEPTRRDTLTMAAQSYDGTDEHFFELFGPDTTGNYYATLDIRSDRLTGTFSENDINYEYTYIALVDSEGMMIDQLEIWSMCLQTEEVPDGHLTGTATLITQSLSNPDEVTQLTLLFPSTTPFIPDPHLEYDTDRDYDETMQEAYIDLQYVTSYGIIYVDGYGANGATCTLGFAATHLTEGEFTYSADGSTVGIASPGYQLGNVYPSYAGYFGEDNKLREELWFIEEGTVTIEKNDGQINRIEVEALNSYGRRVHILLTDIITSLDSVISEGPEAEKLIRNGQLIIRRNGREYNAEGAVQHSCN
ncbi:MAG: hypothetical protein MJZ82_00950 [Paludibacteraceae bacterium]|nr:hypothetical protein [Paludibacteraceae bacterium]